MFYTIITFAAVALTKSRGGIIILLAAFCFTTIWSGKMKTKHIVYILLGGLVVALGFFYFATQTAYGTYFFTDSVSTVNGRVSLINNAITIFKQHPILGNGFSTEVINNNPHNFICSILMRSGVIGIILFLTIFYKIRTLYKNKTDSNIIRACIMFVLCMLGQGLVEIVLFAYIPDFMMWFVIGFLVNKCRRIDAEGGGDFKCVMY